jgi:hypothetical protein
MIAQHFVTDLIEMRSALDACGCNWAFSALRSLNDLLKDLKDRCQKDPEALLNMNLGDFLNTHDKKINRNNETNYAKDAILRFMIDNLEGIADKATVLSKLNQADSSGTPILHHMINQGSRRSVATLMLSGVDPNIRYESSKTPTAWDVLHSPPAIVAKFSREQMRDLMDFQVYSKLNGNKLISKSSTRWDGIDQDMTFASTVDAIDDFRNPLYLSSYPGIETSTWVALSSTSVRNALSY